MESLDDLLSQLKAEYAEQPAKQTEKPSPLIEEYKHQSTNSSQALPQPSLPNLGTENSLLAELKAEFAEADLEEQLRKEERVKAEKIKQEQLQRQRRKSLEKEAEKWLKQLDPHSQEGLWFEEFAYRYPSKLEAAIDYLQVLS